MLSLFGSLKRLVAASLIGSLALFSVSAYSETIAFSFTDDPLSYAYGRTHVSGEVTGLLYGLADNGNSQLPTSIQFTSDVSFLGMTNTLITGTNSMSFWDPTGLNLSNGVVTGGGFGLNFSDPVIGDLQFRLNSQDGQHMNILHWNGSSGPVTAIGNTDGFTGATYSALAPVPEPETYAMILAGLGLLGVMARRRKARQ